MSENNDFLNTNDRSFRLRADILALMPKGAGYALVFCLALWLVMAVVIGIGKLLPAESRDAADPTPVSFLIDPALVPDRHIV